MVVSGSCGGSVPVAISTARMRARDDREASANATTPSLFALVHKLSTGPCPAQAKALVGRAPQASGQINPDIEGRSVPAFAKLGG